MNIGQLLLALAVMMLATAAALGIAKKLNLGSIVALMAVLLAQLVKTILHAVLREAVSSISVIQAKARFALSHSP